MTSFDLINAPFAVISTGVSGPTIEDVAFTLPEGISAFIAACVRYSTEANGGDPERNGDDPIFEGREPGVIVDTSDTDLDPYTFRIVLIDVAKAIGTVPATLTGRPSKFVDVPELRPAFDETVTRSPNVTLFTDDGDEVGTVPWSDVVDGWYVWAKASMPGELDVFKGPYDAADEAEAARAALEPYPVETDVVVLVAAGERHPLVDFEVPVRVLFRGPSNTDKEQLERAVDTIFEHSSLRNCFIDGLAEGYDELNGVRYDGFGMGGDPGDPGTAMAARVARLSNDDLVKELDIAPGMEHGNLGDPSRLWTALLLHEADQRELR